MMKENLTDFIGRSIKSNWDSPAFTDYQGQTFLFSDVGSRILKLHLLFEECGIKPGEKIALVGKNSANWGITYLGIITYGAVVVPVLPDFKPRDIEHIINHSDSLMVFIADNIFENIDTQKIKKVKSFISLQDFSILEDRKKMKSGKEKAESAFNKKYPKGPVSADIQFKPIPNPELAVISYTSGTTGFTKGVMIPHNSLTANVVYANNNMPLDPDDAIVSFLPLAHAYGCAFEFLWPFTLGCHITFLTKTPSPQIILKAFKEIRPRLVLSVPLIIEKIYKKQLLPVISKSSMQLLLKTPLVNKLIYKKIKTKLSAAFGNNFHEVVIGGAPLNQDVELFLNKIGFPFSIGYGMTECGPLISYANWDKTRLGSAGKIVDTLEVKIDSADPYHEVGEIMVRGENVMQGYYKNPEATEASLDKDGWLHTGDLGLIDKDQFIYIKGRSKSMILGPSGQNIYPEEVEARLNNMPFIQEALVVEQKGLLTAMIYPDYEAVDRLNITEKQLKQTLEHHKNQLNNQIPVYMNISKIQIVPEEFEKTPKKSIKRFLYTFTS